MTNNNINEGNSDWDLSSYQYQLPPELIASRPAPNRDSSRLLVYNENNGEVSHHLFSELKQLLPESAHLVFNDSKVYPCRLKGQKSSGGKCELFLLDLGVEVEPNIFHYHAMIKARGVKSLGQEFIFDEYVKAKIINIGSSGTFTVAFNLDPEYLIDYLNRKALVPLPPYIRDGESDEKDRSDYQTIYANKLGSVAAPTAGLHFTKELVNSIDHSFVNLQVGLGTFKPVVTDDIREHDIHSENFSIEADQLDSINQNKEHLIAVGTTSLRVLESCWENHIFKAQEGMNSTRIFLHPGKKVNSVKGLITNFHLPGSSLIMLVSALIGRDKTLELYNIAIEKKYRFFSYGDAMLILRKQDV